MASVMLKKSEVLLLHSQSITFHSLFLFIIPHIKKKRQDGSRGQPRMSVLPSIFNKESAACSIMRFFYSTKRNVENHHDQKAQHEAERTDVVCSPKWASGTSSSTTTRSSRREWPASDPRSAKQPEQSDSKDRFNDP
ncbi:MAG: hypothetical protein ACLVJ6_07670 [Merdibacter sp.]